jgi:hypothetical protein
VQRNPENHKNSGLPEFAFRLAEVG